MNDFGILILAAGHSRRSYPQDKLQQHIGKKSILVQVIENCLAAKIGDVHLVIGGPYANERRELANIFNIHLHIAPKLSNGMSDNIAFGINEIGNQYNSIMIILADMPYLQPNDLIWLKEHHKKARITRPLIGKKYGHPVIFDQIFFQELSQIKGDQGGKLVLEANKDKLDAIQTENRSFLQDVDFIIERAE